MSEEGQSRRFAPQLTTSGLPPTADVTHRDHHFRGVPILFSNSGFGCQVSTIILAGPTVLSAVGVNPPHDGVR